MIAVCNFRIIVSPLELTMGYEDAETPWPIFKTLAEGGAL